MSAWTFRRLARADFPLLAAWLQEPRVARWWADDASPAGLEADYGGCIDGTEPADVFIALLDGAPAGLAQRLALAAYPQYLADLAPLLPVPRDAWSIDYLIGPPQCIGRGLGTAMLAAFTAQLWQDVPEAPAIVVPVHARNIASWRALEKAGYARQAAGLLEPDNPADDPHHFIYVANAPRLSASSKSRNARTLDGTMRRPGNTA